MATVIASIAERVVAASQISREPKSTLKNFNKPQERVNSNCKQKDGELNL